MQKAQKDRMKINNTVKPCKFVDFNFHGFREKQSWICTFVYPLLQSVHTHAHTHIYRVYQGYPSMVFNTTFNNISVISWLSVLLVEENGGVPGKKPPTCRKSISWFVTIHENHENWYIANNNEFSIMTPLSRV